MVRAVVWNSRLRVAVVTRSFSRKSFSICPTRIRRLWVFFWPVIGHSLGSTMRSIYARGLPGSVAAVTG